MQKKKRQRTERSRRRREAALPWPPRRHPSPPRAASLSFRHHRGSRCFPRHRHCKWSRFVSATRPPQPSLSHRRLEGGFSMHGGRSGHHSSSIPLSLRSSARDRGQNRGEERPSPPPPPRGSPSSLRPREARPPSLHGRGIFFSLFSLLFSHGGRCCPLSSLLSRSILEKWGLGSNEPFAPLSGPFIFFILFLYFSVICFICLFYLIFNLINFRLGSSRLGFICFVCCMCIWALAPFLFLLCVCVVGIALGRSPE